MGKKHLVFVTSYPLKSETHSAVTVGVASYSRQLVDSLTSLNLEYTITVLAEKLNKAEGYVENGVKVERVWRRNSVGSLLVLFRKLFGQKAVVVAPFEINMYGSFMYAAVALLGFGILRLSGKKVILILHQVPAVDAEIGTKGIVSVFQKMLIRAFYTLVFFASTRIVVFEKYLSELLSDNSKVIVVPHILPKTEDIGREEARRKLGWKKGTKVALCFGYVSPYKGIERILSAYEQDQKYNLVIAGGINPNHVGKMESEAYVDKIKHLANVKGVVVTGFVPENKIELYIAAADVVVLPYKTMFSSSGPLAWALACAKPVLMSREMSPYLRSVDIADAMKMFNLKEDEVFIEFNSSSIERFWKNYHDLSNKWKIMSDTLKTERKDENIANRLNTIFLEQIDA